MLSLVLLLSSVTGTAAAAAPLDLSTFWAPWFDSPYSYMFTGDPGWSDVPEAAQGSGAIFGAGVSGFYRYGGMWDCLRVLQPEENPRESGAYGWLDALAGAPLLVGRIGEDYPRGFSAYNPTVLDWAASVLVPSPRQSFRGGTFQDAYDQTFFRVVRLHAHAYRLLTTERDLDREARAYQDAMLHAPDFDGIDWLTERYGGVLSEVYPLPADGTMLTAPMAIGFWLRRHLDGTDRVLARHLDTLLRAYDPALCTHRSARRSCL